MHDTEQREELSSNIDRQRSTTKDLEFVYNHKSEKDTLCHKCGKFYARRHFHLVHINGHEEIKKYKCDLCDKSFSQKQSLDRHHVVHTGEKLFSCDICGNSFGQRVSLYRHKKNVHQKEEGVVCDICNETFQTDESLKNHKKFAHKVKEVQPEKQYVCSICERIYLNRKSLGTHIRKKHEPEKLLSCTICGKKVLHPSDLRRHMAQHEGIKIYTDESTIHQCPQCKRMFQFKTRLLKHRRICSLNRFKCDICKKTYQTIRLLKGHLTAQHLNVSKETEDIEQCYLGMEESVESCEKPKKLNVREERIDKNLHEKTPLTSNTPTHQNVLQNTTKLVTFNKTPVVPQSFLLTNNISVMDVPSVIKPTHYRGPDCNPVQSLDMKSIENRPIIRNNDKLKSGSVSIVTNKQHFQKEFKHSGQGNKIVMCKEDNKLTKKGRTCMNYRESDDSDESDELEDYDNDDFDKLDNRRTVVSERKHKMTKRSRTYVNYEEFDYNDDSDEFDYFRL